MFRNRLHLRRWAARVLLVWLFGVGAGLANACLAPSVAEAPDVHAAHVLASDSLSSDSTASGQSQGHDASGPHQHEGTLDQPSSSSKANCQDFCDKASVSIPPLKTALDDAHGLGIPPSVVVIDLPLPAFTPIQSWVPCRDGMWAPPISIAFLRLAL
jgi:hypothetical protein